MFLPKHIVNQPVSTLQSNAVPSHSRDQVTSINRLDIVFTSFVGILVFGLVFGFLFLEERLDPVWSVVVDLLFDTKSAGVGFAVEQLLVAFVGVFVTMTVYIYWRLAKRNTGLYRHSALGSTLSGASRGHWCGRCWPLQGDQCTAIGSTSFCAIIDLFGAIGKACVLTLNNSRVSCLTGFGCHLRG